MVFREVEGKKVAQGGEEVEAKEIKDKSRSLNLKKRNYMNETVSDNQKKKKNTEFPESAQRHNSDSFSFNGK